MELEQVALPETNKVMQAYQDEQFLRTFFDYTVTQESFAERLQELQHRTYKRKELVDVITSFMKPFGISSPAEKHLKELANNAVAIVGGQQAGILTGPLYSVHKAITVLLLANQQRERLGVPVVPIFWIAGEDHDVHEINHVFTEERGRVTKNQYEERFILKNMASDTTFDQQLMRDFVKQIFAKYGETDYTKELLDGVLTSVKQTSSFTEFFVSLMNGLFKEEGLLFIDSAYRPLRKLESDYFKQLILHADEITQVVYEKEQHFKDLGLGEPIEAQHDAANLFYIHETGRVLLTKKSGLFVNESAGLRFKEEELLSIAEEKPWLLSNNVVTRPLMQEFVIPVLSFVGGPGEIAYWSLLKEAFHLLNMKMPIITPRMSITFVTRQVDQILRNHSFTVEDVFQGNVQMARDRFIEQIQDHEIEEMIANVSAKLRSEYKLLSKEVEQRGLQLSTILAKNIEFHEKQFSYLQGKVEEATLQKHDVAIRQYDTLLVELVPEQSLQERVYTPYQYMNSYGPSLLRDVIKLPFTIDRTHKIVYL